MVKNKKQICHNLYLLRREYGLRLTDVADYVGVSVLAIGRIELCKQLPSSAVLRRMMRLYQVDLQDLCKRNIFLPGLTQQESIVIGQRALLRLAGTSIL